MLSLKLEKFEGPLDLLLHLIEKNKVSIYDIPIIAITEQYMDYIRIMQKEHESREMTPESMDIMSDFLVMAAQLLEIKSRMLLPAQKDEEGEETDPREELVARLIEYKTYKSLALELDDKRREAEHLLYKEPTIPEEVARYEEPVDVAALMSKITLARLSELYQMVSKRQIEKLDPIRSKFGTIEKSTVKLSDRLSYIYNYAGKHKSFSFRKLMKKQAGKMEVIVTFLACLELIKIGRLEVTQDATFSDIELVWNENCTTTITKEDMEAYE